jgi:hypothetical protein
MDFLVFVDDQGDVVVFEVFYPDREIIIARGNGGIVNVSYEEVRGMFVLMYENGVIRFVSQRLTGFVF